ncbi:hypothetical protein UCRPC4_g03888 [Phaeomoniella chlamydospora]|uniref:Uncharacterized protein n=1 Tax=Phaeomoniella chlamydospora TaxID=158046 RepID=A0A0G2GBT3_PHACM|nr:hypothetical protein UCRPC4_g03888 [Phaeomoniella chlamydospora]
MPSTPPLFSHQTANEYLHIPPNPNLSSRIIYFIPGNPGLISYYSDFLSLLSKSLPDSVIYGASHAGFEVDSDDADAQKASSESSGGGNGDERNEDVIIRSFLETETKIKTRRSGKPFGLRDQIEITRERLEGVVKALHEDGRSGSGELETAMKTTREKGSKRQVILIGHSVGCYISMEIIRHYQEVIIARSSSETTSIDIDIDLALLLTPTLTHISLSPSGRLVAPLLNNIPYIPEILHALVSGLTSTLSLIRFKTPSSFTSTPHNILNALLSTIMSHPPSSAISTTSRFLRSQMGVKQAIWMGRDEMREIWDDEWEDRVWGTDSSQQKAGGVVKVDGENSTKHTKLVLLFADQDHWVENRVREELIRRRRPGSMNTGIHEGVEMLEEVDGQVLHGYGEDGEPRTNSSATGAGDGGENLLDGAGEEVKEMHRPGPTFIVEQKGELVHGFCIRHNEFVAKKVTGWIKERYDIV